MSTLFFLLIAAPFGAAVGDGGSPTEGETRRGPTVREVREASWDVVAERCAETPTVPPATPGHLVVLELGGGVYRLFVDRGHSLLCEIETSPDPRPDDPELHELTVRSVAALAAGLSAPAPAIEIRRAERVVWRDGSAGCPRSGHVYPQMLTEGARIVLRADGRTFHYHQIVGGAPFLCERPSPIEPLPAAEHQ